MQSTERKTRLTIDYGNDSSHGKVKHYKLIYTDELMPIAYSEDTPDELVRVLERVRKAKTRVKIYLGDRETGRDWGEEHDTTGYIGLSKGSEAYFPILVYNERSTGGGSLLDDRILKVKTTAAKSVLYQTANYKSPGIEIREGSDIAGYTHELFVDGTIYSRHKSLRDAERLKRKLS